MDQNHRLLLTPHGGCPSGTSGYRFGERGARGARGPRGPRGTHQPNKLYANTEFDDKPPELSGKTNVGDIALPRGSFTVDAFGALDGDSGRLVGHCDVEASKPGVVSVPVAYFDETSKSGSVVVPVRMTGVAVGPGKLTVFCTAPDNSGASAVDFQVDAIAVRTVTGFQP